MYDICFPDGNEEKLIERAKWLGWRGACFIYSERPDKKDYSFPVRIGLESTKKQKADVIIHKVTQKSARSLVETKHINILYGFEENSRKDSVHQRSSGLDDAMCGIMHENNTALAISFSSIFHTKNRPTLIGRIMQNVRLARKYRVPLVAASFTSIPDGMVSPHELIAWGQILGINKGEAKRMFLE